MQRWLLVVAFALLVGATRTAAAESPRTAIIAIDLVNGVQEFIRPKTEVQVRDGLAAAGYDVLAYADVKAKLTGELANCRSGGCLAKIGTLLVSQTLVVVTITKKYDSTIFSMKMFDAASGETVADVHEVCDLCGQTELEERLTVAASSLRAKAEAARQKLVRAPAAGQATVVRVAIVPTIVTLESPLKIDQMTQQMADGLNTALEVEAIGGLQVRRQLPDQNVLNTCAFEPACGKTLAEKLGVEQILFISIAETGSTITVDPIWAEPASGRTASRPVIDLAPSDNIQEKFATNARKLLPDAAVRKASGGGNLGGRMTPEVPRHMTAASYATAAVAVVGIGVGIGFGLRARSQYNGCKDPTPCEESKHDSIRTTNLVADAGFAVGIAGAVATVILYATSGEESRLVIESNPQGATVGARFRF